MSSRPAAPTQSEVFRQSRQVRPANRFRQTLLENDGFLGANESGLPVLLRSQGQGHQKDAETKNGFFIPAHSIPHIRADTASGHGLRIDLLLGAPDAASRVRRVEMDREYRKKKDGNIASDHAPVFADLD